MLLLRSHDGKRRLDFGPGYSLCAKQQLSSDRGAHKVPEKKASSNPVGNFLLPMAFFRCSLLLGMVYLTATSVTVMIYSLPT